MTEVELGFNWIESTLAADITLQGYVPGGVFQTFALPGTTAPYILVKYMDGEDHPIFGGSRAYADMRFQATIEGPISALSTIQSAASRLDNLLTVASQTLVTGGTILASYRTQQIGTDEWVDSVKWHSTGGIYRVMAKAA